MAKKQPTSWRARTVQQQKDKNEIYQSREWRELRAWKLRTQPLCEKCLADGKAAGVPDGWIRSARCVHHIHPIEDSSTKSEMRKWAFMPGNLMSLCYECHAAIHKEAGSNRKENVQERRELRQQRWKDSLLSRFTNKKDNDNQGTSGEATVAAQSED